MAVFFTMNRSLAGKRWISPPVDGVAISRLQGELGITRVIAELLVRRGYSDPKDAEAFLHPDLDHLGNPELLPDYRSAVDEILGAKERQEKIYVHGDYDVDGVTSSAIFDRFLKKIGCNVHTHVPHRTKEGYGINLNAVDEAKEFGAKLFLTCDCGITAHPQVEKARALGMRVVVTDHHELKDTMPNAQAVVNPHRADSDYPFSNLSGAGVVFRLCEGIAREQDPQSVGSYRKHYLDFAALGTIADVMPLTGDNRIIAKYGLERLTESKKKGIVALKKVSEVGARVMSYDVGFKLGPRLNAAGRVDDAALSLKLLLSENDAEAEEIAKELDRHNTERRLMQDQMVEEALAQAETQGFLEQKVILVFDALWHPGIVGIVAGKLKDKYNRPAFVGTIDPESGRGKASGRSIPGLNLAEMIKSVSPLVEGGGHALAAGISFNESLLSDIRVAFDRYAGTALTEEDFIPAIEVSAQVTMSEVNREMMNDLMRFEPYGMANPKPLFAASKLEVSMLRSMGDGTHAQMILKQNGQSVRAVAFGQFNAIQSLGTGALIDVVFEPAINSYRGEESVQWKIHDLRPYSSAAPL